MHIATRAARALIRNLLPPPVRARHVEYSMVFSADDDASTPSPFLLATALEAIAYARATVLDEISARIADPLKAPNVWPGELYKLLAGLVRVVQPKRILEIGTGGGTSTLTMKWFMGPESRLLTFDVMDWRDFSGTLLRKDDFKDGRLVPYRDDLSQPDVFAKHRQAFEDVDFIFLDAAKDGLMEQRVLDSLRTVSFQTPPLLVFDDIRLWNMLKIWRAIPFPKLDLTSFGHWTGTGIVEWLSVPSPVAPKDDRPHVAASTSQ